MKKYQPQYLKLAKTGELYDRIQLLRRILESCTLCPHRCRAKRLEGEEGFCRAGAKMVINSHGPHFGEESVLVGRGGSGTIFFSHCNLRCVFCQNYRISHRGVGYEISPDKLAQIMISLQKKGCHNINLVTPSHFVPQIVEGVYHAAKRGLTIPLVYNTSGYDRVKILKLLENVVDIYMPDIKFGYNEKTKKYIGAGNYFDHTKMAVKEMYRQVGNLKTDGNNLAYRGLLIRHLVMPNNLENTEKVLEFVSEEISKEAAVNIMPQYYPSHKAYMYPELSRRLNSSEYRLAIEHAKNLSLTNII
ncbi:MAG: radical SAM protein [Clostridiales bacterium]|nr:radical SAM protein [Clostridiales bacterium]